MKKLSKEWKEKISLALKGRKLTEQHKENIGLGQSKEKHWRWKANGFEYKNNTLGYILIKINGKWMYKHRYIMESFLGRKLTNKELVHHKDNNKQNNILSNLEIVSRNLHKKIHPEIGIGTRFKKCT